MKLPWATWTREQWLYFGAFGTLLILWPGIVYLRSGPNLSSVIYWLTAMVVLAYTVETYGMRREMVSQNELAREQAEAAITPLLVARIEAQNVTNELMIRNIGHGPAFWVEVDEFTLSIARKGAARIAVTPIDVVEPGKAERAVFTLVPLDAAPSPGPSDVPYSLQSSVATGDYEIVIKYENLRGRRLRSVVRMGKSGTRLLKTFTDTARTPEPGALGLGSASPNLPPR
jgi:hypothetical protein